jgi:steroid delta-isomerase-like uncharacterized protein
MPNEKMRLRFLWLLVIVMAACTGQPPAGSIWSPEDFAREWIEAWNSQDIDHLVTYYTEDAFYEDVPSVENGWGGPSRGHEMIREALAEMFEEMPDLGFEFVSASATGARMVVEWIMTGTRYLDDIGRFSIRGVSVITLEDHRIAAVSDYYDAYLLLSQLGMVPALEEGQPQTSEDSMIR